MKMTKSTNKNKLMKIISSPVKALSKVRDFYVNSMNAIADQGCGYGGSALGFSAIEPVPRNFSNNNSLRLLTHGAGSDDLITSSSSRAKRLDSNTMNQNRRDSYQKSSVRVSKSGSVGMARIDEEKCM